VAPHSLLFPAKPASSVLAKSEFDPAFLEADRFGLPDVSSILQSEKLRWGASDQRRLHALRHRGIPLRGRRARVAGDE